MAIIYHLNCLVINNKKYEDIDIVKTHEKVTIKREGGKQSVENVSKSAQMLLRFNKEFKAAIISMFKEKKKPVYRSIGKYDNNELSRSQFKN